MLITKEAKTKSDVVNKPNNKLKAAIENMK